MQTRKSEVGSGNAANKRVLGFCVTVVVQDSIPEPS